MLILCGCKTAAWITYIVLTAMRLISDILIDLKKKKGGARSYHAFNQKITAYLFEGKQKGLPSVAP
jgi:hypothetical protein